jgi:D-alanyl-D-alanine carboxypeptidase
MVRHQVSGSDLLKSFNHCLLAVAVGIALSFAPGDSFAAGKSSQKSVKSSSYSKSIKVKGKKRYVRKSTRPAPDRFAALVVDANTGRVLYEKNAGNTRYPASLTKMMTLYLTFDALKRGEISMDDALPVSLKAASQPQTNIGLEAGDRLPVRSAIESLVVRSANDSSIVLAEAIGGTEWNFALLMNKKARELGMHNTMFRNPNGLPDNKQHTTAYDMARLAIALRRDFPEYYPFFKLQEFSYGGVSYNTHNHVMERYDGADGVKTGYINASGFNLVTSVRRDGYMLVAVVMGGTSASARDNYMIGLLDRTFADLQSKKNSVAGAGQNEVEGDWKVMKIGENEQDSPMDVSLVTMGYTAEQAHQ